MALDIRFPDGNVHSFPEGTTPAEIAAWIGPGLARAAVAAKINGRLVDLTTPLHESGDLEIVTLDSETGRHVLRHSTAHVLAQAVLRLFPEATFAIGPPIEDGFYYDFDVGRPFTPEDLERIEEEMRRIVSEDQPFVREELSRDEALEVFRDHPYKREIIESVEESEVGSGEVVTVYRNDGFVDLCRGPHLPSTGRIPAFKLLRSAGAYWRGDETRPQLQRIYGTAWESKKALDEYLERLAEAERRDHRRLGPELDLFSFPRELGAGLVVWHPDGGMVRKLIEDRSRALHEQYGFRFVYSPHLAREDLWRVSGHLDWYSEYMYPPMRSDEGESYRVKPMNCPFHILVYRSRGRSYRDLPLRLAELGSVYRFERSGVLHGMLRLRGFTQDDSHTFCTREQLGGELQHHLDFVLNWLADFGFDSFEADLSTRNPEKWMGSVEAWDEATEALRAALDESGIGYRVAEGEAAFYGPKIDVHIHDAIGRRWQMSTIQVDFMLPERFGLEYVTPANTPERPVMIHCAKAGSIERFMGVLVEHYAGAFPLWLAPVQVTLVPVADRHLEYAHQVAGRMRQAGLRVEVDSTDETVGEKIRRALTAKHPVVAVVGDRDVEAETVGLRFYGDDEETRGVPVDTAIEDLVSKATPPRPGER
ncbi:MAG: threonine--tRNA ligase [Acidimicrobiia bacterium]|nr:MAG: threonine--tRNA ligase [Acidimicrobiia bacterium]